MTSKEYLRSLATFESGYRERIRLLTALKVDNRLMHGEGAEDTEKIKRLEEDLTAEAVEVYTRISKALAIIEAIRDGRYKDLLMRRYIQRMSLTEISEAMGYDYDYVRALHGQALKEFDILYKAGERGERTHKNTQTKRK